MKYKVLVYNKEASTWHIVLETYNEQEANKEAALQREKQESVIIDYD